MARGRWAVLLAAVPLLAGCMTLDADLAIREDHTVRYEIVLTETRGLPDTDRPSEFNLCGSVAPWFPLGVELEAIDTAEDYGCRISGVADIDDFGRRPGARSGLIIVQGSGEYTFVWGPMGDASAAGQVDGFELSVSFPGLVTYHSGSSTVWLNTVTWRDPADLFTTAGLTARGGDAPSPLPALLLGFGLLAGLGLVAWLTGTLSGRVLARSGQPMEDWEPPDPTLVYGGAAAPDSASPAPPLAAQAWAPTPDDLSGETTMPAQDWSRPSSRRPPDAVSPWAPPG